MTGRGGLSNTYVTCPRNMSNVKNSNRWIDDVCKEIDVKRFKYNEINFKVRSLETYSANSFRLGMVNSNTINSKFHLIRSYCKYLATILSFHLFLNEWLIRTWLIRSSTNLKGI